MADLGFIGVGAIADAIVTGLCGDGEPPAPIHLSPRNATRANRLAASHPSVHIAESNQAVLDRAGIVFVCVRPPDAPSVLPELTFREDHVVISVIAAINIDALGSLVAPATDLVRTIPLPAVATRTGLTAIHPAHEAARSLFEPLGGVLEFDDETRFNLLSPASAAIAAHLAYLDTISRWLVARGISHEDATRYVAAIFGSLLDSPPSDFTTLADEYATPGGFNERFLADLRRAGTFGVVERALDEVYRLESE